jgi:hypothetical protein
MGWKWHPYEFTVRQAAAFCTEKRGGAAGDAWTACVLDILLAAKQRAVQGGQNTYFPVVAHDFQPLRPAAGTEGDVGASRPYVQLLKQLLRNYSCDAAGGGSEELRSISWEYTTTPPPCGVEYSHRVGVLAYGSQSVALGTQNLTERAAIATCESEPRCVGFSYQALTRYDGQHYQAIYRFCWCPRGLPTHRLV